VWRVFARKGRQRPRWAGALTRRNSTACLPARRRPVQSDLPGTNGHEHVGAFLVPHYTIRGMVCATAKLHVVRPIDRLDDVAHYRPTVHYAYCPAMRRSRRSMNCAAMTTSCSAPAHHGGRDHERCRHSGRAGDGTRLQHLVDRTDLSIEESRRLVPHQNATTMQVAISAVAAVMWMIEHRDMACAFRRPASRPHPRNLQPYLGKFISTPSDWTPLSTTQRVRWLH